MRFLQSIGEKADREDCAAFVVGGVVRDLILKRDNLDLDIVLEADAVKFAQEFSREYDASVIVYKQFKTATIVFSNGLKIDFATARKESYPYRGALPVVRDGAIHDDLSRRDFTINALAIQLNKNQFGQLRDDFQGLPDLKRRKIRILYDQSFLDDPTRILRAVRFEQRFYFQIEKKSLDMLKLALKKNAVSYVKPPRYFEEFKKIFREEHPEKALQRLKDMGGLDFLKIRFKDFSKIWKSMKKIEKNLDWYEKQYAAKKIESWLIYFLALLEGVSVRKMKTIFHEFNFKKADRKKILSCKNVPGILKRLDLKTINPSQIFQLLKPLSYETILFLKAKALSPLVIKHIEDFLLKYEAVRLSVDGNDLAYMGIPPGKVMGDILKNILCAKIDGFVATKEDELKIAQKFYLFPKKFYNCVIDLLSTKQND